MKVPGLVGTISAVAGLVLAIPMALVGVEFIAGGRVVFGLAFLGLAGALLFLPEYVRKRLPRPWHVLTRRGSD